jgi:hypothetical protein
MAYGAVDLRSDVLASAFVAALEEELASEKNANRPLEIWINRIGDQVRVTLFADFGNIWLGGVVARAAGDVDRAVLGLDHDEYGAEHVVLDGRSGALLRVHHVYVYPEGAADDEYAPVLAGLPARHDLAVNPDGTLTGVDALAAAAALYDIDGDAMVQAVRETAKAHEHLQIVFTPLAPWWQALGVTYPHPRSGRARTDRATPKLIMPLPDLAATPYPLRPSPPPGTGCHVSLAARTLSRGSSK